MCNFFPAGAGSPIFLVDCAPRGDNLLTVKDNRKHPATTAEDELFKRGSPKSRELLAKSRKLKRDEARREWKRENL